MRWGRPRSTTSLARAHLTARTPAHTRSHPLALARMSSPVGKSWKDLVVHEDEDSILGKASQREVALVDDHAVYNQRTDLDFRYIQEREHFKRRRVMSRWRWASEMAGEDGGTAKAAALMKALYAEDHNETLGDITDQLLPEEHFGTSLAGISEGVGDISNELKQIAETTKDGLSEIAACVGNIDPSDGQTDMSGVEASLDALTEAVEAK